MNLHSILAETAARQPQRTALIDVDAPGGQRSLTYGELWLEVRRIAAGLEARGLRPGERVAMLIANSWEYVVTFFAISAAGLVSVPMNIRLLEDELAHMVEDSGARLLIADASLLGERASLRSIAELGTVVVPGMSFENLAAAPSKSVSSADSHAVASLFYTSGTTGLPKGVMLTHFSWKTVSDYVRQYLGYAADEVTLHTAALTHGSGFLMLPTFAAGGTNVVCAKFDAGRVLSLFGGLGVTNGFFVPTMIQMLLDVRAPAERRGWRLKNLYYAGSPIDPGTLRGAIERFGPVLVQSFAQAEAPMFLTAMNHAQHQQAISGQKPQLIRSAGRVVAGVQVRIVDDADRELPTGQIGEIVARAPHVMQGYWNRPDATQQTLRNGWLYTGDVGCFDDEGYLYIVDRKKDMIISGGANVYAREVEQALLALEDIKEVAVIGLPHPKWGEIVTAVMVSRTGRALEETLVDQFCRTHIADYRRPKRYIWVDALPRNAYGKILKRELRTRFSEVLDARSASPHA